MTAPPGYPPPPASSPTVGQATASFVLGLIGLATCFVFLPSLAAVVLGLVALRRVAASGGTRGGKGLAVTGIVLGGLGLVVGAGAWLVWSDDEFQEGFQEATAFGFEDIDVGDCVSLPAEDARTVLGLVEVDCDEPHGGEVYATASFPAGTFPGDAAAEDRTVDRCLGEFGDFVGVDYDDSRYDVYFLYPREASWEAGDRAYLCIVIDPSGEDLPAGTRRGAAE